MQTPTVPASGTSVPKVISAFVGFCVFATAAECILILFHNVLADAYARIVPFVGWLPGLPFMAALYWAFQLRWRPSTFARRAAFFMLLLGAVLGLVKFLTSYRQANYGNPWLTVSAWQPVATVALPLVWFVLLLSPAVVRFCRAGSIAALETAQP